MMDINEKTKCFQEAFLLARKDRTLTKPNIEVFKKLRRFLDRDIVDKIDNFKPGNKGILLVGGDFDLLSGIVSYIWYKHPLIYPMSGNEVTGNASRSYLAYKNFAGHNKQTISGFLFSKNLLSLHMHGRILFLRNIKTGYTDILERIAAILQEIDDSPILYEERGRMLNYGITIEELWNYDSDEPRVQRRKEWPKFKLLPSILVMNIKQTEGLEDLLQNFEVIELGHGKTKTAQAKIEALIENRPENLDYKDNTEYMKILDDVLKKYNKRLKEYPSIGKLVITVMEKMEKQKLTKKKWDKATGELKEELLYRPNTVKKHLQEHQLYKKIMIRKKKTKGKK